MQQSMWRKISVPRWVLAIVQLTGNGGGGPWMAVDCGTDVVFDSKETIAIYNSSEWAARGFCRLCGSHLFYRLKGSGQYMMPVGLFGEAE